MVLDFGYNLFTAVFALNFYGFLCVYVLFLRGFQTCFGPYTGYVKAEIEGQTEDFFSGKFTVGVAIALGVAAALVSLSVAELKYIK